jgi:hypothetical protein
MWVVAIRQFGADEVDEIVGPFEREKEAHEWVICYNDDNAWYDVLNLIAPVTREEF